MRLFEKIWLAILMLIDAIRSQVGFGKWLFKKLRADVRGSAVKAVIGIAVALFVIGALLPSAIIKVSNSTAYGSTVDASVKTICIVVLPMLAVVGIALKFLGKKI